MDLRGAARAGAVLVDVDGTFRLTGGFGEQELVDAGAEAVSPDLAGVAGSLTRREHAESHAVSDGAVTGSQSRD